MTIDDVLKLTPEQAQRRVAELTGNNWDYHKDLNLAVQLVPQGTQSTDFAYFTDKLGSVVSDWKSPWEEWANDCLDKPLALCRAYILWKEGAQ